jgi:hypothetical protein
VSLRFRAASMAEGKEFTQKYFFTVNKLIQMVKI